MLMGLRGQAENKTYLRGGRQILLWFPSYFLFLNLEPNPTTVYQIKM
jgi:hypothetical protein